MVKQTTQVIKYCKACTSAFFEDHRWGSGYCAECRRADLKREVEN